jgi:hypothetical protein
MHSATGISGEADDVAQGRFWFGPPDKEDPSAVGRSTDVAILLVGLARYTTGLQIELAIRCRIDPDLGDRMHPTAGAGLFAGVELPDRRDAAADGRHIRSNWPTADQPVLTRWGGGGGREWSSTLWSTPAPPRAPALVVADRAPTWTSHVPPWMPRHVELRPRRSRSCGRASLIRRIQPLGRRRSAYRPGAISHGYFRR